MNPLFEKLEAAKINVIDLLQPEDKTYWYWYLISALRAGVNL
jgi:hypothetical protein